MKRNTSKISYKRGFTLIELLVVVLIIGILAAVAVPQYKVAVYKSRYSTLKALTKSIAQAQEIYYLANGRYATSFKELDLDMPGDKTNESTDIVYYYDWGNCHISDGDAICKNSSINMEYQVYRLHGRTNPSAGRHMCVVLNKANTLDIRDQICQTETGKTTTYYSDDNVNFYKY